MNAISSLPPLVALSASQLSLAIQSREVSCRDVMTAYLSWIERMNPAVNAIVSLQDVEGLLGQADERDHLLARGEYLGWMHGFPQAPKDLAATVGITTTLGSPLMTKHVPQYDAIVVERAKRSGAILIGKTNTPELGLGSHTYNPVFGTTRNAYDQSRTAGGSSGGAAVALALHMLPVADGSDMMGSLRNPAAYNNIFGFRPSLGRVPNGPGNEVFYQQFSTEGPMARTVTDLAMLLSVQAGYDVRVPLSLAADPAVFAGSLQRDFKGTRIGWLGDMDGYLPMEDGILNLCGNALTHFEDMGASIEHLRPGFAMDRVWSAWLALRSFLIAGKFGMMAANPVTRRLLKPEALWEIEQGQKLSAADVYRASTERSGWYEAVRKLFEQVDFLVLPTAQVFPFDATLDWPKHIAGRQMDTYHRWMEVVVPATLAGLPAISVPAGFNEAGLPIGLQIIGKPQDDLSVLQIAYAYEQVIPYTRIKPRLLA